MSFRKHILAVVLGASVLGSSGAVLAADEFEVPEALRAFIEVFVHKIGNIVVVEVSCGASACPIICPDVEGTQVILRDTFYQVGPNCSLTITDGALLQEAIETVVALVSEEIPGGFAPVQDLTTIETELENPESNPQQNAVECASPPCN